MKETGPTSSRLLALGFTVQSGPRSGHRPPTKRQEFVVGYHCWTKEVNRGEHRR